MAPRRVSARRRVRRRRAGSCRVRSVDRAHAHGGAAARGCRDARRGMDSPRRPGGSRDLAVHRSRGPVSGRHDDRPPGALGPCRAMEMRGSLGDRRPETAPHRGRAAGGQGVCVPDGGRRRVALGQPARRADRASPAACAHRAHRRRLRGARRRGAAVHLRRRVEGRGAPGGDRALCGARHAAGPRGPRSPGVPLGVPGSRGPLHAGRHRSSGRDGGGDGSRDDAAGRGPRAGARRRSGVGPERHVPPARLPRVPTPSRR